jgi:5-formyltetrahydrofolate cyclo-ligase
MPAFGTSDDPAHKARLRREVRAKRGAMSVAEAGQASRRAVRRLWSLPFLARARSVAMYLPIAGELDCTPLAIQAWDRGRSVFLPVISGARLRFAPLYPGAELRANRLGIMEPAVHARRLRSARELEVIVVPLVAFDEWGHRLGMGGGYYDRTLAFRKQRSSVRRPHFVGVAFEIQKLEVVPVEEWDVRLDVVVTERTTYRFT